MVWVNGLDQRLSKAASAMMEEVPAQLLISVLDDVLLELSEVVRPWLVSSCPAASA